MGGAGRGHPDRDALDQNDLDRNGLNHHVLNHDHPDPDGVQDVAARAHFQSQLTSTIRSTRELNGETCSKVGA